MRLVGWDTETALQRREMGRAIPPLACMSWATRGYGAYEGGVFDRQYAPKYMRDWLRDPEIVLIGHYVSYDVLVMCQHAPELLPLFFAAYEAGRVRCTYLRERLVDLREGVLGYQQKGHYALDACVKRYTGFEIEKEDTWRLRYGELIPVPIADWPADAVSYAINDAKATLIVYENQGEVADDQEQARDDFALKLSAAWGVRTDPVEVAKVERDLITKTTVLLNDLQGSGLIRARDGSQDKKLTQQLVEESYTGNRDKLYTEKGNISTSGEILAACSHPLLHKLDNYLDLRKTLNDFVPWLKLGTKQPLCPNISTLQKNGRTSCSDPNLQQLPREGGVRECYVPRPGHVFIDGDYSTLEVRTFAQVLWWLVRGRTLMDLFQRDPNFDPHSRLAAQILSTSYDDVKRRIAAKEKQAKDARQMSKPGNFGFQGGMGVPTFVGYAWNSYKVRVSLQDGEFLKSEWFKSVPEARAYFRHVGSLTRNGHAQVEQFMSRRVRGGMTFTDLANGYWSALANDGAKHSLWLIVKDCYANPNSYLYGSRVVIFGHDQHITETPDTDNAHDAAMRQGELAREGMRKFVPDVPIVYDPALTRRWSKDAGDPVYDRNKRLVPYQDVHRRAA